MNRSLVRTASLASLICLGSLVAAVPAHATSVASSLSNCVNDKGTLDLVALVDQSGSIAGSDPHSRDPKTQELVPGSTNRASALKAALGGLAESIANPRQDTGDPPKINLLIAGFYGGFEPAGGWTPLTVKNLGDVYRKIDEVTLTDNKHNTDYVNALFQTHKLLLEKNGGKDVCRAMITVSDGGYLLKENPPSNRTLAGKMRKGISELCSKQGERSISNFSLDDVYRFVVALEPPGGLKSSELNFLKMISTGASRCGSGISPATGELLTASKGARLYIELGNLLAGEVGKPQVGNGSFVTKLGIERFVLNSYAPSGLLTLTSPSGESKEIRFSGQVDEAPSEFELAGVPMTVRWNGANAVRIEGKLPIERTEEASASFGRWQYSFPNRDQSGALSRVALYAWLSPGLAAGEPKPTAPRDGYLKFKVSLMARSSDGTLKPVTTGPLLTTTTLKVALDNIFNSPEVIQVKATRLPAAGQFLIRSVDPIPLHLDDQINFLRLIVTPQFHMGPSVRITPQPLVLSLPVVAPPGAGYPVVTPVIQDLGDREGPGQLKGTVKVSASHELKTGTGSACFGRATFRPSSADSYSVSIGSGPQGLHCVRVRAGQSLDVPVTVNVKQASLTSLSVSIPVSLESPLRQGVVLTQRVELVAHVKPESDTGAWLGIVLLLVVLGIVIPLILLHLMNYFSSEFQRPSAIYYKRASVAVDGYGMRLGGDGTSGGAAEFADGGGMGAGVELVGTQSDKRRISTVAGLDIQSVTSGSRSDGTLTALSLFQGPFGKVSTSSQRAIFTGNGSGGRSLRAWRDHAAAEIPLSLWGTWVFVPQLSAAPSPSAASTQVDEFDDLESTEITDESRDGTIREEKIQGEIIYFFRVQDDEDSLRSAFEHASSTLAAIDWTEVALKQSEREAKLTAETGRQGRAKRKAPTEPPASSKAPTKESDAVTEGSEGSASEAKSPYEQETSSDGFYDDLDLD